jgi:hypothetical protein
MTINDLNSDQLMVISDVEEKVVETAFMTVTPLAAKTVKSLMATACAFS